jgi:hypothetical protein
MYVFLLEYFVFMTLGMFPYNNKKKFSNVQSYITHFYRILAIQRIFHLCMIIYSFCLIKAVSEECKNTIH